MNVKMTMFVGTPTGDHGRLTQSGSEDIPPTRIVCLAHACEERDMSVTDI